MLTMCCSVAVVPDYQRLALMFTSTSLFLEILEVAACFLFSKPLNTSSLNNKCAPVLLRWRGFQFLC